MVEHAAGWSPMVGKLPDLAREIARIKERVRNGQRDRELLDFCFGISFGERDRAVSHAAGAELRRGALDSADAVVEAIGRHRESGFNHLGLSFAWQRPVDYLRQLEWFAQHVLSQPRVR